MWKTEMRMRGNWIPDSNRVVGIWNVELYTQIILKNTILNTLE